MDIKYKSLLYLKALELCLNIPFILWFNRCALVGPDEPDSEKQ